MARLSLEDLWITDPPPPPWLIPGVMADGQLTILAGDAGTGKSFLALTWAHQLAAGLPILGSTFQPQRVLYINEENSWYDIREYVRWARYGMNGISEGMLKENLRIEQFTLSQSPRNWHSVLRTIANEHQARLIFIDTATPACGIQDENDNAEASSAIRYIRQAMGAGAPGCGSLVLKHAKVVGPGEDKTIRGAKAWRAACDGLIFHTKTAGRPRADGLHCTYLWPDKARAFGLRERLKVTPQRTEISANQCGIFLAISRSPSQD